MAALVLPASSPCGKVCALHFGNYVTFANYLETDLRYTVRGE
jgi:hypothetical protein